MKTIFKKVISVIAMAIFAVSLVACGANTPKPEETAKNFLDSIKQQDINKAATFVKGNDSKEKFKYESAEQEKLVKAIFSKLEYTLGEASSKDDTATVKVSITSVDLPSVTTKVMADVLPTMMAQAISQENVDKKKQEAMVFEELLKGVNGTNAPKIKKDITMKLVKGDKGWLIDGDEQLLNAITGDIGSLNQQTESK